MSLVVGLCANSATTPDEFYLESEGIEYTYVTTKGGKKVLVYLFEEEPLSILHQWQQDCQELYPRAVVLASASNCYNCHSYAWIMKEGGVTCWLDPLKPMSGETNLSHYWTDGNYARVSNPNVAEKIVYYNSNDWADSSVTHSAVESALSGYYDSKWGRWPLVRHEPDYVPPAYGTNRQYFVTKPSVVSGILNCSKGNGEIRPNVTAMYSSSNIPQSVVSATKSQVCYIETAKGDDAVDNGSAVIESIRTNGVTVTFTQTGMYEMFLRYYNERQMLIAEYWYQALVTL